MRTYLDCIPCFMKQTLNTGRRATCDETKLKYMLDSIGDRIKTFPLSATPPEMGEIIYRTIREISGVADPFIEAKAEHIRQALDLYPELEKMLHHSKVQLNTAIRIAIAGNVIDLGMDKAFDIHHDLHKIMHQPMAIDHFEAFTKQLNQAGSILYLGDNAGESVFDKILIQAMGKPVTYVVRDKPVINDVTYKDAVASGIEIVAKIISSGSAAPGIFIEKCSSEMQQAFYNADLIISKGQGNYESLSETQGPIFFLLKAKCLVVAKHLGVKEDDIILKQSDFFNV